MTTLTYTDAYLKALVTTEIENRAIEYVATFGTFAQEWIDKLTIARAYEIVCIEYQNDTDDLFNQKRTIYAQEFKTILAQARIATPDVEGNIGPIINIPLERG